MNKFNRKVQERKCYGDNKDPTLKNLMFCEMLGMLHVTMTESSDSWVMLGADGGTISVFCDGKKSTFLATF